MVLIKFDYGLCCFTWKGYGFAFMMIFAFQVDWRLFAVTFYRRHLLVCRYAYVLAVRLIRLFVKGICLFGLFASLIARDLLSTPFFSILFSGVYACLLITFGIVL
jgi:hypothetical protein